MSEPLKLQPMTEADYLAWRTATVREYAEDKVLNGAWTQEESIARSEESFDRLLPVGLETPDNWLHTVRRREDDLVVGHLWFAKHERDAYLYDIVILEPYRRRGYGRGALRLFHAAARERGFVSTALHVFGHNTAARDFYLSEGYAITDLTMRKTLG